MEAKVEPIEVRTRRALDATLASLQGITPKNVDDISGLLNDMGMQYERQGPTAAEILAVGKREDSSYRGKHNELDAVIRVVHTLAEQRLPPAQAGYMLKKLPAIKKYYQPSAEAGSAEEEA